MNIIYQSTFSFDTDNEIFEAINKVLIECFTNFYTNDYPIVNI